ncbi:hypothetical protein VP5_018 [Vibrio virus VPMCC5]|nr:hypothetical protein VP5_018 [Vibrio virus VPMCC5]
MKYWLLSLVVVFCVYDSLMYTIGGQSYTVNLMADAIQLFDKMLGG